MLAPGLAARPLQNPTPDSPHLCTNPSSRVPPPHPQEAPLSSRRRSLCTNPRSRLLDRQASGPSLPLGIPLPLASAPCPLPHCTPYTELSRTGSLQYKALNFDGATSFFGLYNGEEGSVVPKFCGKHLHEEIRKIEDVLRSEKDENADDDCDDLCTAIKDGFLRMDEMMKDPGLWIGLNGEGISYDSKEELKSSLDLTGSQACVIFVRNNNLIVANVGLSRCYMSRKNECFALTTEHKPVWAEKTRVIDAGGFVLAGEVRGHKGQTADKLPFTRALGYMSFKQNEEVPPLMQIVIAKPVVRKVELRQDIEFIILAPSLFWISMTKEVAFEYARVWIKEGLSLSEVCENLRMLCLTKLSSGQSTSNLKVIIIQLEALEYQVPVLQPEVPEEDSTKMFKHRSVVDCVKDPKTWKRLSKTYILTRDREPAEMCERLRVTSLRSVESGDDNGQAFTLPSLAKHLYEYNPKLEQVCLRRGKTYVSRSISKNKSIVAIMATTEGLLKRNDSDTARGVSYRVDKVCNHEESDTALKELCLLTESTRPSLNVFGTPTGSICGPIVLIANGTRIDCEQGGRNGMKIPFEAEEGWGITAVECKEDVEYMFVLEKETTFFALRKLNFHKKNKCVLITGGGMPDITTRIVVRKLKEFLKVPVYCFVDANPFGLRIYSTYKFGSVELAFDNQGLTVLSITLIGMSPEDIERVLKSCKKELSDEDKKCLESLLKLKHIMKDKILKHHLKLMKSKGCKAQIEL